MPPPTQYRRNVAIFILDAAGKILACERSDVAGAWQIPQGGIDSDESPDEAMLRELEEEIGTNAVEVLGKLENPIRYEWPEHLYERGYRGQEQYYYLVRLRKEAAIDLGGEFRSTEWIGAAEFASRLYGFKSAAYLEALEAFLGQFPGIISA